MRYRIDFIGQRLGHTLYRVFDTDTNDYTRGRFHTLEAAQDWVTQQVINSTRARVAYHGRATAHLLQDADYYGTNERICRGE